MANGWPKYALKPLASVPCWPCGIPTLPLSNILKMVMNLYPVLPGLHLVLQTNNELEAQRVATEFAFRKRLREMEKMYSELKWQEKNVSLLHASPGAWTSCCGRRRPKSVQQALGAP